MHRRFDHEAFEKKWQKKWKEQKLYDISGRDKSKEKEYVLVEWPYPSGNLHIGHWYAFAIPDIYARFQRMQGKQVLFPMGFDAFGLPAENAALKHDTNPKDWTNKNIEHMRSQLDSMGSMFSWSNTTASTDPDYYRWTQWMFTEFFKNDVAYRGKGIVNWCPGCHTVIANEQVQADGTCERSGDLIEKKEMPQWMLRITDFADELVDDLDSLDEWPEAIKDAQRNWIGRSRGAEIDFTLSTGGKVTVFTTRPDTLFGATYLVLAPESALVQSLLESVSNKSEVESYISTVAMTDEQDRLDAKKEKTGVQLVDVTATNPATGEEIPVYIADYVLGGYGTGAVMAVPAHDQRDYEFAQKYDLPIKQVVTPSTGTQQKDPVHRTSIIAIVHNPRTDKYMTINWKNPQSTLFVGGGIDGDESEEEAAIREIREETSCTNVKFVSKTLPAKHYYFAHNKNISRDLTYTGLLFTLVDDEETPHSLEENEENAFTSEWKNAADIEKEVVDEAHRYVWDSLVRGEIFTDTGLLINSSEFDGLETSEAKEKIVEKVGGRMTNTYRLRDWSVGRQRYWGVPIPIVYDPEGTAHPVPEEHLPWILPEDVDFAPTGEAPLAKSEELKKRTEEIFGVGWTPEVETMDTFVDSSWYYLRYIDAKNEEEFSSKNAQESWLPVDTYFGGAEHTTMHLLYSRFWQKALHRLGLTVHNEPYQKRVNRGLIIGPDGNKMSKSKGNVIDPDEQVKLVGSDTVKMYLAFMGPYQGANYPWDNGGVAGVHRFLERAYGLRDHISEDATETIKQLHKTIQKVGDDIREYKFNTAISALMVFANQAERQGLTQSSYEDFVRLLAPFAPHLTETMWEEAGKEGSVHLESFPEADQSLAADSEITIGVQVNGKLRGNITISPDASEEQAVSAAHSEQSIKNWLENGEVKKIIYVPGRILNFISST